LHGLKRSAARRGIELRKFFWLIIGLPVAVLLIVFSVANRQPILLRLDPFNATNPAIAFELPFFVFLFAALLIGMIVGGLSVWLSQGRYRKSARHEKQRADTLSKRADDTRQPPAISDGRDRAA
jgi:uncharacterized integral membrane protein